MLPAYMKIHDQIKKDIDEGSWKIGERLPSERDLAEEFEVSRMTLRQAISLLVEEGFWSVVWAVGPLFLVLVFRKKCVEQLVLRRL